MLEPRLIELLRCPVTKRRLIEADQPLLARLNETIQRGQLTDRIGNRLSRDLDSALIDTQREHAIPVFEGIPSLIPDNLIPLIQLEENHAKSTDAAVRSDATRIAQPD